MRKRKPKIDTTPKIFMRYEEVWDLNAYDYYTFPVMKDNHIEGYRLTEVSEAEEEYRYLAEYTLNQGYVTEKQIVDNLDYPLWFAAEIIMRQNKGD